MIEKCIIDYFDEYINKNGINPLLKTARNILNGMVGMDLNMHHFADYGDELHFCMHKDLNILNICVTDKVSVKYYCPWNDHQQVMEQSFSRNQTDEIVKYIKEAVK